MWVFLGILAAVSLAVAVNILPLFSGFGEAFRHAIFTAASVMSTSGFAISDFNLWPWLSKTLLVVLMFVGACAGSTGGGIKIVRIVIGAKLARRGVQRAIHPQQVKCVHIDGEPLDEDACSSVSAFLPGVRAALCAVSGPARAGRAGFHHNIFRRGELL